MRKLLLLTFTMTLLCCLSVNLYAQWGKTVTVANDEELVIAIGDRTVEEINLIPGQYNFIGQTIEEGDEAKILRAQPSNRSDCDYFIQVGNFCVNVAQSTTVFTFGPGCPVPDLGFWSVVSQPAGSTVNFLDIFLNPLGPPPHPYAINFTVNLPGEYVLRYDFPDGQFVQGNYYAREIPLLEVPEVDPLCEGDCFNFVVTVTRNLGLPVQSQALPPYELTYAVNGGTPVTFFVVAADLVAPGVYQKTLQFCDYDCGDYEFIFTLLQSNNNQCGGAQVIREVEIYDEAEFSYEYNGDVCGLATNFYFCAFVDCAHEDMEGVWTVSGPGNGVVTETGECSWAAEVDVCGTYDFTYTVTNGPCESSTSFSIKFYDKAEFTINAPAEVCGTSTSVEVCATAECLNGGELSGWWQVLDDTGAPVTGATVTPGNGDCDFNITVPVCGVYTFKYTVENGPCESATSFKIAFFDSPNVNAGRDQEVCGLETTLAASWDALCEHPDAYGVWSVKTAGPGDVIFDDENDPLTGVTVTACGEYVLLWTVYNNDCPPVSDDVKINFYDAAVITMQDDDEVCGLTYELEASYFVECPHPDRYAEWSVFEVPDGVEIDDVTFEGNIVSVPQCGVYVFKYYAENGFEDCSDVEYVTITFYEQHNAGAGEGGKVCGLTFELDPWVEVECVADNYSEVWSLVVGPEDGEANFDGNTVTVTLCGQYQFAFTVTNGPCLPVTSTVIVDFYSAPEADAGIDQEICGLETYLAGTWIVECPAPGIYGKWTVKTPGPGDVVFEDDELGNTKVTVTACGNYELLWTVYNNDCPPATDAVWLKFFDVPVFEYSAAEEVCGFETQAAMCAFAECEYPGGLVGTWSVKLDGIEITTGYTITQAPQSLCLWDIEVEECGVYEFTYSVVNGPCSASTSFTVTFYQTPDPQIQGPDQATVCDEDTYTVLELSDCYLVDAITYTWSLDPAWAGNFVGGNTGTSVTIQWNVIGSATLKVVGQISDLEECYGEDEIEIEIAAPKFAGQVKYWNQFETYMPTPYPTKDYATYPHDYFYVELWHVMNQGGPLAMTNVEPYLAEVQISDDPPMWELIEYMSYFEFDLAPYVDYFGCEGYYLKIWDGGLVYHYGFPGGSPLNPPLAGTHLGNNYTYNNWGGVNATDALSIQLMATWVNIQGAPYNFAWVGPNTDLPRYGYYSHSAADVNSSNPYTNGGITALDALTTNYRAVGLIAVFPNSNPGVQYSPNFRVTGRLVPSLPYMTWPMPFDYDNVDDVPFTYPLTTQSYLYFTNATLHKYTSAPIALSDKNFINIYYLALGDINSSYVPTSGGFKAESDMMLAYEGEQNVSKGQIVSVPIRIDRNAELGAISLVLRYNPSLIEVVGVNLDPDFYRIDAETGMLYISWFNINGASFAFGDAIATIQVRVLGDINANTRFFELEAGELANTSAQPIKNINIETVALSTVSDGLFITNYPNPFRTTTMISYSIPEAGNVNLIVYNKLGQVVETLVSTRQDAGTYQVEFGRTDLTPGVYFYKIVVEGESNTYTSTNSMIFIQ